MFSYHTNINESGYEWPLIYAPGYYTLGCQANAKLENSIIPSKCYNVSI